VSGRRSGRQPRPAADMLRIDPISTATDQQDATFQVGY
jgi:hypothetical protein